jgi:hypothetical protein
MIVNFIFLLKKLNNKGAVESLIYYLIIHPEMHSVLNAYLDKINSCTTKYQSIYLSIGSAAGLVKTLDNGSKFLEECDNQQYPPCMKKLKLSTIDSDMHIILIDKMIEKIPYIVANHDMSCIGKEWRLENHDSLEIYHDDELKIHVYVLREYVRYDDASEYENNFIDIFSFLVELNNIAIHKKIFLLANDFCGRSIRKVKSRFTEQIKNNLDHIIYGFDHEGACYINLSNDQTNFVFSLSDRVTIFTPVKFKNYKDIVNRIEKMNIDDKNIALTQLDEFINNIDKDIKNLLIPEMRKCKLLCDGKDVAIYPNIIDYFLKQFNQSFDTRDMYSEKNYTVIFEFCKYVFKNSCQKIFIFFDKPIEDIDILMILILSEPDVYKWTKIYNNYITSLKI